MKIAAIQSYNNNQYNTKAPSFNSWRKYSLLTDRGGHRLENLRHTTATQIFRDCPNWKELTQFLAEKYKNIPKINVYDYGCSNGSEAYTFLIAMFNDNGYSFTKKFTPIKARDYDGSAIYKAQSGKIDLDTLEISAVQSYTNGKFKNYFYSKYNDDIYSIKRWSVSPLLTDNIEFECKNIIEDYKNIESDNTIVFARNFWPYLKHNDRELLAKGLYSQLGQNSILITGGFDRAIDLIGDIPAETYLLKAGFKPSKVDYIFEK